jgi:hypothetical protein
MLKTTMFDVKFIRKSIEHLMATAFDSYSIGLLVLSLKNRRVLALEEVTLRGLTELDKCCHSGPIAIPASCETVFHLVNKLQRKMEMTMIS